MASAPTLLQRSLPASGAAMVAVESAAELPGDRRGKEKRNGQSRRYRERVRRRQEQQPQEAARVITKDFFRSLLRPARLL
jgi:hypothetical protein